MTRPINHSPVPWAAGYNPYTGPTGEDIPAWEVHDRDGHRVATTDEDGDPDRQAADARLIATAPLLLASLRRAVGALNRVPAFRTDEGISSYRLLPELEAVIRQAAVSHDFPSCKPTERTRS